MLVVILVVAAWVQVPVHIDVPGRDRKPARVTLLPSAPADANDPRLVQSPVLFSLPTRAGFSGLLHRPSMRAAMPPLPPPADLYLTPTPEFPRSHFGLTGKTLDEMMAPAGGDKALLLGGGPVELGPRESEAAGYRVHWQDDPVQPVKGLAADRVDGPADAPAAWEAVYFVCLDPAGFVDRLLVEVPPPTANLNEYWIRRLRGWQADPPAASPCRRLVVNFQPARGKGR